MFFHDGVMIVISVITGGFAVKAARVGSKINDKVGNGFTEKVQNELKTIKNSQLELRDSQLELVGAFNQHVKEHEKWSRNVEARISHQRKVLD